MFEELDDEITSINSIYGDNTLRVLSGKTRVLALTVPAQPAVTLRVEFSPEYPDVPPSILGTQSVSDDASKGDGAYLAELVRSVLSEVYTPGSPCIFDLVEEVGSRLEELSSHQVSRSDKESGVVADDQQTSSSIDEPLRSNNEQQFHPVHDAAPWLLSEVITEKKSVFVARCAPVDSVDQAKRYLAHLLSTDKKVAKATHNITAWRIRGSNGVQYQDCDDDGETAAGGRVLHLLELMGVWDAMVVVSRWYGGVHLGPDRFRIINQTARDAVVKAGFGRDAVAEARGKKGRG